MKKAISLALAGMMMSSVCVCAYAADNEFTEELKTTLAMVKERINVPKECSEFNYGRNDGGIVNYYNFNWYTPDGTDYRSVTCTAYGNVITDYDMYYPGRYNSVQPHIAELSKDELYAKARAWVKKLNPTICNNIEIDKDSISMRISSNYARFDLSRVKNGVPVKSDSGYILLDKNTGELYTFGINWHPKASFQSPKDVISEEDAQEKYEDMIGIEPLYEIYYDYESDESKSRLVYRQTDYGEINAFTGKKSDFIADGYFGETEEAEDCVADAAAPETGGPTFTKEELAEINMELPYSNEKAAAQILKDNEYFAWSDDLHMEYSYLNKEIDGRNINYIYHISFSNNETDEYLPEPVETVEPVYEDEIAASSSEYAPKGYSEYVSLTLNAKTGAVIYYDYNNGKYTNPVSSYDLEKADKKAKKIAKDLAPDVMKEYTGFESEKWTGYQSYGTKQQKEVYYGSYHSLIREVNGIKVSGSNIEVAFDADMTLTSYRNNYIDVDFAPTDKMLSADKVMDVFWKNHDIELYYNVRAGKRRTASVLVYGVRTNVYADAFTGEQIYDWDYEGPNYDFSGISDQTLRSRAQTLADNGVAVSFDKISENDTVKYSDFMNVVGAFPDQSNDWYYDPFEEKFLLPSGNELGVSDTKLTRGDAMVVFTQTTIGRTAAELKGIYRTPFTDVKEDDEYIGYYALAYAMGAAKGTTLNADSPYTYADLINLGYEFLAADTYMSIRNS